jgi:hypothetical protein
MYVPDFVCSKQFIQMPLGPVQFLVGEQFEHANREMQLGRGQKQLHVLAFFLQ